MADKKISALTGATTPLAGTEVLPIVQGGSTVKVAVSSLTAGRAVAVNGLTSTANIRTEYSAPGNVTTITNNTSSAAGAASQLYTVNDASRALRIQYSSSGGAGGAALTNGISTETAQIFTDGNYPIVIGTNVSAAAIIDTSQNVKLINNLVIGTAGKGIDFSANGGNILNQYAEGSWAPVVTASSGSITSYTSSGRYTRVGRVVTAVITFKITNIGAATGALIASLPFPTDAVITYIGAGRDDNTGNMVQGRVTPGIPSSIYFATYINGSIAATNTEVLFSLQFFV